MDVPILITCECGARTAASAGDSVTCACARRYETELTTQQKAGLVGMRHRMRAFARLGIGIVGLLSIAALAYIGPRACFIALAIGVALWWGPVQIAWRRRCAAQIAALPPGRVSPL